VAYEATPLNVHRRHAESVTHVLKADLHVAEIARCHQAAATALPEPASETLRPVQAAYLREVATQLGTRLPVTPEETRAPEAPPTKHEAHPAPRGKRPARARAKARGKDRGKPARG
jgi:hypothetical protein